MHIHILGICGTFMGGIAVLAKAAGHRVTGCDANVYPPMSTQLGAQGIELIEGFDPAQTKLNPDIYVIGNVVSRGNPLMEEILNQGLPYISGPQWLAENVLQGKWVLAVAGTHGKTTTSSMLAWILEYAGLAPGFLIGGVPENFAVSARLPQAPKQDSNSISPFFVIEADEYDTAFFDKRSKFVHYRPRTAVLNNLEFDHADIFEDLDAIEKQFHHLVRTVPQQGLVVANGKEASLQRVIDKGCWTPVEKFGTDADWQAANAQGDGSFNVLYKGKPQGRVAWNLLGEHNRMNALASIAAGRHAGVAVEVSIAALTEFKNVKRRMETRGEVNGVTVYDDFAHHPTAIETTVAGLRAKVGSARDGSRILAVLEPRSNTMKLGVMKNALPASLQEADLVFCYQANLGWDATEALAPISSKTQVHDDLKQLVTAITQAAKPGDHVLVMSNGGFGGVHQKILDALKEV
ncbi:MAG: UDP-N-acetylmuramate:L-alanyl-gamma-D-glutamyl-meso-diaminopimelate ligase [Methylotenera sp.]|nr:UDP-N-acetylmuramate:L-alanyl-gamma-D-glutamyl-meso-diaminopimelate ligase [Methylotenera sp.]MDO9233922.1 UDP-N-acetylmuramate:L-alanyl-gamma-D-glutamyl-meso-diaminopimelate ligase [Methylotenera sp.]MDO9388961.1 UDP-N-acetylmuramate:L-alanyl-gamma-D-glutamyl-meso-diaminopimelate ligase [Methylotenera sp.]MDP2102718.1 UDP-N-acetylmuramate:L-alanyl-gamma-D-glutamyl-meso-diaminopimelate ligase [Methylotenera sp.]MDP2282358.1 UDP-N-acetylmuramate:L-alanyl-gamma-D-glutamyl-meso-diaminopimelate 